MTPASLFNATRPRLRDWVFGLVLLASTAIAYLPAWHGQPIWDDEAHLTQPALRSVAGLAKIWTQPGATQQYYPLVHSAFWFEHKLWQENVLGYHLVNILLHVGSAFLLLLILRQLKVPGAWLAAGIFALHPVQVESVAWISEQKNTLSTFFFLGAALIYLYFDRTRKPRWYFAAVALFVLALLSKTVVATLPAVLLVIFWWQRGSLSWKRDLVPLLPMFVTGALASVFTAWMEVTHIGAEGNDFSFSIIARCLIGGRAFWFYLSKLLWPARLTFIYPRWQIDETVWWQYLFPLAVLLLVSLFFFWRKRSRAPLAALLLFAGLLFPALGFLNVFPFIYSFVADHFQYLASLAVISMVAAAFASGLGRIQFFHGIPSLFAGALLLLMLASLTWKQCRSYTDGETLYRSTLEKNPSCWMAENNLANMLVRSGRNAESIEHYRRALQLRPNYVEAHYNFSNVLLQSGAVEEAIEHCEAALRIQPASFQARNNLGNALTKKGRFNEAIANFESVLAVEPENIPALENLAWLLATCSDLSLRNGTRAVQFAERVNRITGAVDPLALRILAAAHAQNGDFLRAVDTANRALMLARQSGSTSLIQTIERDIGLFQIHLNKEIPE